MIQQKTKYSVIRFLQNVSMRHCLVITQIIIKKKRTKDRSTKGKGRITSKYSLQRKISTVLKPDSPTDATTIFILFVTFSFF